MAAAACFWLTVCGRNAGGRVWMSAVEGEMKEEERRHIELVLAGVSACEGVN